MSKGRILVIDDSPIVRKMAEIALEEEGYEVYTAENGEDGIKITEAVLPSVILIDFIMPKMSGYQFCQAIKENETLKNIPIILITGKGEDVGRKFYEKFKVSDYFIKPFKSADLVDKVNSIMQMQSSMTKEAVNLESAPEEPVTFELPEPITAATIEEQKITEIPIPEEPVTFELPEPITAATIEEQKITEIPIPEEPVIFELPEIAKTDELKIIQKSFKESPEKIPMEYLYISEIQNTFEKVIRKVFQEEFQCAIQKNISDIIKQTCIMKSTDVILSGALLIFPIKNILYLADNGMITGKLSIFSDFMSADIYFEQGKIIGASKSKHSIVTAESSQIPEKPISEDLINYTKNSIYDTISAVMELKSGNFFIEKALLPDNLRDAHVRLTVMQTLIEVSRRANQSVFVNIFNDKMIFIKNITDGFLRHYNLSKSELLIYACINGERTLSDIIELTGFDRIQTYRILFTLLNSEIIKLFNLEE